MSFLRGIFSLEELYRLLPGHNNVVTEELQQLFDTLMLKPQDLLAELLRQSQASTNFKGDLFMFLRGLSGVNDNRLGQLIANFLKAFNGSQSLGDIKNSISNNLLFLGHAQSGLKNLSEAFLGLSEAFKAPGADFEALKQQVLALLSQQQSSLLNSPATEKVSAMLLYNLSRYQSNSDFLPQATARLANMLSEINFSSPGLIKNALSATGNEQLLSILRESGDDFALLLKHLTSEAQTANAGAASRVMDALAEIIVKEGRLAELQLISDNKINDIIASLLSSPCNYTPLLHFVFPLDIFDMKAFAEMWINNHTVGGDGDGESEGGQHVLIAFDIEGIGSFETEIYTQQNEIQVLILCPEQHTAAFSAIAKRLPAITAASGYRLTDYRIDTLHRGRSLLEVFSDLPAHRMGLSVKA